MPRYLLKEPWVLRGFLNAPYAVIDPTGQNPNPVRRMNQELWNVLLGCDGQVELGDTPQRRALEKAGLIVPAEAGAALAPEQRYRVLPFDHKPWVQFSITGRCNLNCLHCFMAADKERQRKNDDLTGEQLMAILDQLLGCGVCRLELTGGEPLVSPHFASLVKGIAARHMRLERILTNGFLVDDALFDLLEDQGLRPQIVISFDGLGVHNWMRNHPQAQERAEAAMELTVKRGFPLRATVNLNRATLPGLVDTCRYLVGKGAKSLYLIRTSETPRWSENAWVEESLPFEAYYQACCDVAQADLAEGWQAEIQAFNGFTLRFGPKPYLAEKRPCAGYDSCFMRCGRAAASFFISHTGQVWPCDAFEGIGMAGGFFDQRSLKEDTLEALLGDSTYAQAMAVTLDQVRQDNESCAACPHFAQCGGGCRAFGYGWGLHEKGYQGSGKLTARALTHCTYYRGGYAGKIAQMVEEAARAWEERAPVPAG